MKPGLARIEWNEPLSAADFEILLRRAAACVKPGQPQLVKRPKPIRKDPRAAA
jgi:hypothetical protein